MTAEWICTSQLKKSNYLEGDFAVVGAGLAESDLEGGFAFQVGRNHFLAFEGVVFWEVSVKVGTEDNTAFGLVFEGVALLLDHQTAVADLGVGGVGERGSEAASLFGRFAGEFEGQVDRIADGVDQRLEHVLEFLSVPLVVQLADVVVVLERLSVQRREEILRVQGSGGGIDLFNRLGGCWTNSFIITIAARTRWIKHSDEMVEMIHRTRRRS